MTHLGDREDSSVTGSENEAHRTGFSIDVAVVVQSKKEYPVLDQPVQITATAPSYKTHLTHWVVGLVIY